MNTDNIDRFGHCVVCHKNLITKRIVDGQVIEMFLPIHGHTDFMLDNGSIMKVCICTPCKESTDLNDPTVHANIMEAVQKGWLLETKILVADPTLPEWTQEKADSYLADMSKLSIDSSIEGIDKDVLRVKSEQLAAEFRENA